MITAAQVVDTARSIASLQRPDGMIPWYPGGHCDPWNHVEAAMALTVAGIDDEADRAYRWLVDTQLPDGSWFNYYLATGIEDSRLDTNVCAYLATGAWHRYVSTGDLDGLEQLWPAVEAGVDFVLRWQRPDGSIHWSLDPSGFLEEYALLTGSSSIYHSLRCAVACAERLGHERPDWELAAGRLAHAVAHQPEAFAPKEEFAMDWYYPILAGALTGEAAHRRMEASLVEVRDGRSRCPLRLHRGVGHGGRDRRVRPGPRRHGTGRHGSGASHLGPGPAQRGRLLLDRHGLSRGGDLPAPRALVLHGGCHDPGRRRPQPDHAGIGDLPGEGLPSHLDLTEPAPGSPVEPALRSPGTPGPL